MRLLSVFAVRVPFWAVFRATGTGLGTRNLVPSPACRQQNSATMAPWPQSAPKEAEKKEDVVEKRDEVDDDEPDEW